MSREKTVKLQSNNETATLLSMIQSIDCVIPAAGSASRFGRDKLSEPWENSTILETVVSQALRFFARVILVTGYNRETIKARFGNNERISITDNEEPGRGMFSSIQTGLRLVSSNRFAVTLGDMPGIPDDIIEMVLRCRLQYWCRPRYGKRPGHPVLMAEDLLSELLALPSETGTMRDVLLKYPGKEIRTDDIGVYLDVDTEADYKRLLSFMQED